LRDARLTRIEEGDALFNGRIHVRRHTLRSELHPPLKRAIDNSPKSLQIARRHRYCPRKKSRIRSAASTHCATGATSEILTPPPPGFPPPPPHRPLPATPSAPPRSPAPPADTPPCARARYLPGTPVRFFLANNPRVTPSSPPPPSCPK